MVAASGARVGTLVGAEERGSNVNDDQAPLPMRDQAHKRGQLIWHLEEALALADDTPARVPVLRNLTKQWLKLALELERTQASLDEREPKPKRQ